MNPLEEQGATSQKGRSSLAGGLPDAVGRKSPWNEPTMLLIQKGIRESGPHQDLPICARFVAHGNERRGRHATIKAER